MGRYISDSDDDNIDPNAPTQRIYGRRPAEDDDAEGPTLGRRSPARDQPEDDERTRRFRGRKSLPDEDAEGGPASEILPVGWLVIVEGPGVGHVLTLQTGMNILGRGAESQVVVDFGDTTISREDHARIAYNRMSRKFHVAPGKGPETWLKGELVMQPLEIARGDLITIGETVLRLAPFCDESFDWSDAPR